MNNTTRTVHTRSIRPIRTVPHTNTTTPTNTNEEEADDD